MRREIGVGSAGNVVCFTWSDAKLRMAGVALAIGAVPVSIGCVVPGPLVQGLCLVCLAGIGWLAHWLGQRIATRSVVLSIDARGILDNRLTPERIAWQDIAAIWPADVSRSYVVDIELRWPDEMLACARGSVRLGAALQKGYGVPAVTISMLLLDGTVGEFIDVVARWRPDLLHPSNRRRQQAE